jgi:hypothetical protein
VRQFSLDDKTLCGKKNSHSIILWLLLNKDYDFSLVLEFFTLNSCVMKFSPNKYLTQPDKLRRIVEMSSLPHKSSRRDSS